MRRRVSVTVAASLFAALVLFAVVTRPRPDTYFPLTNGISVEFNDSVPQITVGDMQCVILGQGTTMDDAFENAQTNSRVYYPHADHILGHEYTQSGTCYLVQTPEQYNTSIAEEMYYVGWLAENLPLIVPNGTDYRDVPDICARWIADRMTYDEEFLSLYMAGQSKTDPRSETYPFARQCFEYGIGVCETYASALQMMVENVPINPDTMLVDYACVSPKVLSVYRYHTNVHSFNAVILDGKMHYYDISTYDRTGDEQYLDFPASWLETDSSYKYIKMD